MKKQSVLDMSGYDNKLRLRFDRKTALTLLIATLLGGAAFLLLKKASLYVSLPVTAFVFFGVVILGLASVEGTPLRRIVLKVIKMLFDPTEQDREYLCRAEDDFRLTFSNATYKEEPNETKKAK